jgi:hypothetical protein
MTQDEIVKMAREAGINVEQGFLLRFAGVEDDLERFAALVAAAEREACAKLCDEYARSGSDHEAGAALNIQDAIRARGEKK